MPAPVTHIYIALKTLNKQAFKLNKKDLMFFLAGSIMPDIGIFLGHKCRDHEKMRKFTDYLSKVGYNSYFIEGMKNHYNADDLLHGNYINPKAGEVAELFSISKEQAHGLIENAMNENLVEAMPSLDKIFTRVARFVEKSDIDKQLAEYFDVPLIRVQKMLRHSNFAASPRTNYQKVGHAIRGIFIILKYLRPTFKIGLMGVGKLKLILKFTKRLTKADYGRYLKQAVSYCTVN